MIGFVIGRRESAGSPTRVTPAINNEGDRAAWLRQALQLMPVLTARVLAVACAVAIMSAACGSRALTSVDGSAGGGASGGAGGNAGGAAGSTGGATGVAGTGGSTPSCANVGCALPPLCGEGCREPCGCCACAAGTQMGNLVCVGGCYGPAVATDAGPDASAAQDADPADRPPGDWIPPDRCLLPFDPGPCDGSVRVFAFVNGACVQQGYGGCQGNANRFSTLEECLATCEGRPDPRPCPTGRVVREICVACGGGGGCGKYITACALTCTQDGPACPSTQQFYCFDGVCQTVGCF
jgi:hypothetical protein